MAAVLSHALVLSVTLLQASVTLLQASVTLLQVVLALMFCSYHALAAPPAALPSALPAVYYVQCLRDLCDTHMLLLHCALSALLSLPVLPAALSSALPKDGKKPLPCALLSRQQH